MPTTSFILEHRPNPAAHSVLVSATQIFPLTTTRIQTCLGDSTSMSSSVNGLSFRRCSRANVPPPPPPPPGPRSHLVQHSMLPELFRCSQRRFSKVERLIMLRMEDSPNRRILRTRTLGIHRTSRTRENHVLKDGCGRAERGIRK